MQNEKNLIINIYPAFICQFNVFVRWKVDFFFLSIKKFSTSVTDRIYICIHIFDPNKILFMCIQRCLSTKLCDRIFLIEDFVRSRDYFRKCFFFLLYSLKVVRFETKYWRYFRNELGIHWSVLLKFKKKILLIA